MTPRYGHYALARLVLETRTPLSIVTGRNDGLLDTTLVRDANGLPMIPGPAIAGVLRHLHERLHPHADEAVTSPTERLFGFQHRHRGQASRLQVSHGVILDGRERPVEGLLMGVECQRLREDPLLARALRVDAQLVRDRVRIGARGAAEDQGLFDRTVLPAGYRFVVEIGLWLAPSERKEWFELLALFAHPLFRLGGATRAGLGSIQVKRCHQRIFALDARQGGSIEDRKAFAALSPSLGDVRGLEPYVIETPCDPYLAHGELILQPRHFWRIGGGSEPLPVRRGQSLEPDLLPKREPRVEWHTVPARLKKPELLIPAASIKGVLAHRTLFHAHRLAGRWAEDQPEGSIYKSGRAECSEARELFGEINDHDQDSGRAGCVYLDDAWIPLEQSQAENFSHNAIDRFTGGVRNRLLFSEQVIVRGQIRLSLMLDTRRLSSDSRALEAFHLALADLVEGRLPFGARTSTGMGYCRGSLRWTRLPPSRAADFKNLGDIS